MRKDYDQRVETTDAERIALAAAKLVGNDLLNEMYASFGVNRADVESMKKFRKDLEFIRTLRERDDIVKDLEFLTSVREGSIKAGSRFVLALITIFAASFAWGMATGFREWLKILLPNKVP